MCSSYSKLFMIIFFTVLLLKNVQSQTTVGVSPPVVELGSIERGETKIVRFNVITSSEDVLTVRLQAYRGNIDFFSSGNYKNYVYNYSEEDISSWVEFLSNPVELKPVDTGGRSSIKNAREVVFLIHIPEDAEPGYHSGYIMLDPNLAPGAQKQVTIKTVFPLTVLFDIPGKVKRDGEISDIKLKGYSRDTAYISINFKNMGNVTLLPKSGEIKVFDNNNNLLDILSLGGDYTSPGESKVLSGVWSINESLIPGSYRLEAKINYVSGATEKISFIQLTEIPPTPASIPIGKIIIEKPRFSIWLLIVIMAIIISCFYWYKKS